MCLRPPRSTLTDTLFPCTTLFRSRCRWATRVAVPSGVIWEIAGNGDLRAIEVLLPKGERIEAQDAARGTKRIAIIANGRLVGALSVTETGELPPRDWLIAQLAAPDVPPPTRNSVGKGNRGAISVELGGRPT